MRYRPTNMCNWRFCRMVKEAGCAGRCRRHYDMALKAGASQRERIARDAAERFARSSQAALNARMSSDEQAAQAVAEALADERHQMAVRALIRGVFG